MVVLGGGLFLMSEVPLYLQYPRWRLLARGVPFPGLRPHSLVLTTGGDCIWSSGLTHVRSRVDPRQVLSGDATPCKVTPVIQHGVVSSDVFPDV